MTLKFIELNDDILVEIASSTDEVQQISGGDQFDKVNNTIDQIRPLLLKVSQSVVTAWKEANKCDVHIDQAEIELALGFEAEGNLYIARGKADAHLTVKLILNHKD